MLPIVAKVKADAEMLKQAAGSEEQRTLRYLIGVASQTAGAEVWRALFAELLKRAEERNA